VDWALGLLDLDHLADRMPDELSHGQRKLVGVARALAAEPRLVCMDEPAAGLDSTESELLGGTLRRIIDHGTTIFLVDHDMGLVLSVCDFIYVIEFGHMIASGTPAEIRQDERVIVAYLGERARKDVAAAKEALETAAQVQHG
jgi:branched-chain amino acid transport system ATP-binding protein